MSFLTLLGTGPSRPAAPPAFSPLDLTALAGWYKADAETFQDAAMTTPATVDDTVVEAVDDQSTNNRPLARAACTLVLKTNIKNGLPVLRSAGGGGDYIQTASIGLTAQPWTVFVVAKMTNELNLFEGKEAANRCLIGARGGFFCTYAMSAIINGLAADTTNFHLFTAAFNGASSNFRVDGVDYAGNPGTAGISGWTLFARGDGVEIGSGDWGELIVCHAALSAPEITDCEAYLNDRWAVF